ncbi:hypothetical protein AQUCO_00600444v1 [Aquilegia coerulea]|uniref:Serpin domain-containing protein n=1 Tax=Aquilegia coerulea TaxID=218851 RepID=A0A2G5EQ25_AQUCA|nr:hypothetical protein AQUCO_00600444v1 [Aquilegia coerulea]
MDQRHKDGGFSRNKTKKKNKNMDDQQQDYNTNWQQTYGGNFSGFGANIPSKRNKTTGAPFPESGATFQSTPFQCIRIVKDLTFGKNVKNKNFVFSPCSIQLALSLLANGAKGSTLDEFLKFLEVEDRSNLNSVAREFFNKLSGSGTKGGQALSCVSGVWVDNSLPLNPTFVTVAESIYHGKAEVVDFKNEVKANEVLAEVNKWAEEATGGLIKSVLPRGSFNPLTRIVLGNALYFKGKWAQEFVKSGTKHFKFYLPDGKSIEAPFMTNSEKQFVRTFDGFKVLRLPYKKSTHKNAASLSMYIILPDEIDGLLHLTEMVCSDPLFIKKYVHDSYQPQVRMGRFWVPKFEITHDFEASKVLQDAGIKLRFSSQAEFDDLLLNPGGHLKISQVVHKSCIKVDEEGTEAAAVTMVMLMAKCARRPPPPVNFVADHPFMFMIRDDASGMGPFGGEQKRCGK